MTSRLTELLYISYLLVAGLPHFSAAAHRESAAFTSAAGFRAGGAHVIPARWTFSGQPNAGSGS
ncbi:hypothetical protein [Streptomyces sp. NPDC056544]|uniref:hypothetical protein n=1 Tax=unclassified Streptomyces TaxID=2593676 RepID=UPI0036C6A6B5